MWLVTTLIAAIVSTVVYFLIRPDPKYRIDRLSLMLWGATGMILVDHIFGYIEEGGAFISLTTDGAITSSILLGLAMLVPVIFLWQIMIYMEKQKENRSE